MYKIKFSHDYPKLHSQKYAKLLYVTVRDKKELSEDFIEYDTAYGDGWNYNLPDGQLLLLCFIGEKHIPFTTARKYSHEKEVDYRKSVGYEYEICVLTSGSILTEPSKEKETINGSAN